MLPEILHASLFFSVNSYFFLDQAEPPPPSYLSERHPMLPGLRSPHCEEGGGGSECPRAGARARLLDQPLPWQWSSPGQCSDSLLHVAGGKASTGHAWKILCRKCVMKAPYPGRYSILFPSANISSFRPTVFCLPKNCTLFSVFPHIHQLPFCVWDISYLDGDLEGKLKAHVSLSFDSEFMLQRCPKFPGKMRINYWQDFMCNTILNFSKWLLYLGETDELNILQLYI